MGTGAGQQAKGLCAGQTTTCGAPSRGLARHGLRGAPGSLVVALIPSAIAWVYRHQRHVSWSTHEVSIARSRARMGLYRRARRGRRNSAFCGVLAMAAAARPAARRPGQPRLLPARTRALAGALPLGLAVVVAGALACPARWLSADCTRCATRWPMPIAPRASQHLRHAGGDGTGPGRGCGALDPLIYAAQ